ncbi:MAG: AAA family ATPase [Clostridia bacterium]|nr:AAA family ATPase [Clostridia bacterium]
MKHLYMIGGPMGVGKTAVCQALRAQLDRSVFLDGDWCWAMHPFIVTEETKAMVTGNIVHLLSSFLRCSEFEHVVFCWVMHEQSIIDRILEKLPLDDCQVHSISLVCSEAVLKERLQKDINAGLRTDDVVARSLARLPLYDALHTMKIDTSTLTIQQTAQKIAAM